jgi:hypothetical protein
MHNLSLQLSEDRLRSLSLNYFATFLTAQKSTGSIMWDCAICYVVERHCGYHAEPDQPPFEPKFLEYDSVEEEMKTAQILFEALSYVDMRQACRDVVQYLKDFKTTPDVVLIDNILVTYGYLLLFDFESSIEKLLDRLDAAVKVG